MKRMKLATVGAATAVLALMSGTALAGDDGDAKLIEIEKALWAGWAAGDAKVFEKYVAQESVNMVPAGFTFGRDALVKDIGSGDCKVAGFTIGDVKVIRPADHVAILAYSATQDAVCGGHKLPPSIRATSVYVKKDGNWKAAAYTETPAAN